ncbi:MAG: BatD family protein [bacterium]
MGKMPRHISQAFLAAILLVAATGEATAELSISVRLQRNTMRAGEKNQMTIEIVSDSGDTPNPQIPQIDGLTFHPGGSESSYSFSMDTSRGQMKNEYKRTLSVIVVPVREGTYTIEGVQLQQGSQTVVAAPVTLTVLKPGDPLPTPPPNQRPAVPQQAPQGTGMQLIVEPSKTRAYVGEAVTVRYFLVAPKGAVQSISIADWGNLNSGLFKRCVVEEVDLGTQLPMQDAQIGGRPVNVVTLKHFIVFPLSAGPIAVDPVTMTFNVGSGRQQGFFNLPFAQVSRQTATAGPMQIEVIPLPTQEQPDDFDGAVGEFTLQASVSKSDLVEGDAFSLRVIIGGKGNIKNSPPPTLPDLSQFDQYENTKKENVSVTASGISGRITYEYVLVPKSISSTEIGPVRFSYFSPEDGKYHTLSSEPIHLTITPRGEGPGDRILLGAGAGAKREIILTGEDFRHIALGVTGASQERLDLYRDPIYIILFVTPFLILAAAMVHALHRGRLESDPEYARHRRAPRIARRLLSEARSAVSAGDSDRTYAALSKALVDYVGDRWNLAATGMTTSDLGRHLQDRGLPDECVGDLIMTLEDFQACRFGGGSNSNLGSDLHRTEEVLSRLMAVEKGRK